MTVYCLFVGIDAYDRDPLCGAVNDIRAVETFVRARIEQPDVRTLTDGAATRAAVIDGFRGHLARAGRGDVTLFWFAGHGSSLPVPDEFAHIESSGRLQTLVCADSRRRRPDGSPVPELLDKEMSVLLSEVAANGAHVVAVLDSCHAGGALRGGPGAGLSVRSLDPSPVAPRPGSYLPEIGAALPAEPGDHVLLAACELTETAKEVLIGTVVRGVFTHALLTALQSLEPQEPYRRLVALARSGVQELVVEQSPLVWPPGPGPADEPFLGGVVVRPTSFHMSWTSSGWQVDAGRCHGLPVPGPDGTPTLSVPGGGAAPRLLEVHSVGTVETSVEPIGWSPNPGRVHPVVLASVPVPRCGLVIGGTVEDDEGAVALVADAVRHAGPDGWPSPEVRVVGPDEPVAGARLWIGARVVRGERVLRILRADGEPVAPDIMGHDAQSAAEVVRHAEHIARWDTLRTLDNPISGLAGAVRIEIMDADRPDTLLVPGPTGEIGLRYRGEQPPGVLIRLRNLSDRILWCTLLDLTDQHRVHDVLFPCAPVGPGVAAAAALEGKEIKVWSPASRVDGCARDWLKLIVAEERFSSLRFHMPALGEPATRGPRTVGAVDAGRRWTTQGDWTTVLLPLVVGGAHPPGAVPPPVRAAARGAGVVTAFTGTANHHRAGWSAPSSRGRPDNG